MKEKIFLHDLHIKRIFLFVFLFIYLALNTKFEAQAVQAHWTYWNEFDYSNGNLIADGYYSYYNDRSSTAAIRTSAVPMTVTINGKEYPQSIQEIANAAGITSSSTRGNYDVTLNYDGFSIEITTLCAMSTRQMQFRDGDMFDISVIIPKGSNINVGNGDIRYYGFRNDTDAGSSAVKFTANVNDKLNHIKSCNGGSMQHDANQHWQICNTCGYTKIKKTNHAFTTTKAATCTAEGQKKCNTCGYTTSIPKTSHQYQTTWESNGTQHWHKCKNCSATTGHANHNFEKKYDNGQHWDQCKTCGYKKNIASHSWTYSNWDNPNTHDKKCSCGKTVTGEKHSFTLENNSKCACGRYNNLTVSFDLNKPANLLKDTVPSSVSGIKYTYGDKYYDSKYNVVTPTLADYTFDGWYTAASGGTKITSSTVMNKTQAHTLYAHWKAQPMAIKKLNLASDTNVIEYNGQNESAYKKEHDPKSGYAYGALTFTINTDATIQSWYKKVWEEYDGKQWKALSSGVISESGNTMNLKNITRQLDGKKIRLTIYNNAGNKITSNEAPVKVYYLPEMKEILVNNKGFI